jgi:methylmalonyl-CoA mutase cobalamin-binding domain/chain
MGSAARSGMTADLDQLLSATASFERSTGRRPRLLVVGIAQAVGGSRPLVAGFAAFGFDVDAGPSSSNIVDIARQAVDSDVHGIVLLSATAALVAGLRAELVAQGVSNVLILAVAGSADVAELRACAAAVIGADHVEPEVALDVLEMLRDIDSGS